MNRRPQPAAIAVELASGVSAVAPSMLWLHAARALVAADVHFGYEDVIGGALPLWSTGESADTLRSCAQRLHAREIILLGDVIHGSRMSDGAARRVRETLESLRGIAELTLVAGNHEGATRGAAILGTTVESVYRDGWLLLHGDRAPTAADLAAAEGVVIGHLHPSLPLGANSAPAFLAGRRIIVVPALTPYSRGLNLFSDACLRALRPFNVASRSELNVVVCANERLYPFGSLSELQKTLRPDG